MSPYPIIGFLLLTINVRYITGKGGATKGAAGGGATVVSDGGQGYTPEEMNVALIIVGIIIGVFVALCTCQCYQKVAWEFGAKHAHENDDSRPMPSAPYLRDQAAMV
ncbi:hypothetical protein HDE_04810 [Halotydeus destructor]|nr:hypothetical protein HDE_04810 [Halotydeus destructor]